MPTADDRDDIKELATRIAKRDAAPGAIDRLGELIGLDLGQLQVGSGVGELDSVITVLMLPRAEVARLLPQGLELAPHPFSAAFDEHPVLVQRSHYHFDFGDMTYDETMLAVPYVQLEAFDAPRRGPFLYMPRLYLNETLPRLLGVYLYGYEKEAATIDHAFPQGDGARGHYRVKAERTGASLLEAAITSEGGRDRPGAFAEFATLRQLLEMPTISQAARIWDEDAAHAQELSPFLASNLEYRFDAPDAWLEPVRVKLTIARGYTPPGLAGTYELPSLKGATLGAFRTSVKVGVALPGSPATMRYPVPKPARRQRVLVLGGGPAACAAAYWLARQRDRYEVQMYTHGFRLGGKCAAGVNPRADHRVEEHGLHAFLGFYENAFRTVRSVYQTAGIPLEQHGAPFGGAFIGSDQNGLMIRRGDGWRYYRTPLSLNDRVPGRVPEAAEGDDEQDLSVRDVLPVQGSVSGMGEMMVEAFRHAARQTTGMERRNVDASRQLAKAVRAPQNDGILAGLIAHVQDIGDDLAAALRWDPPELVRFIVRWLEDRGTLRLERWLSEGSEGPLEWVLRFVRLVIRVLDEIVERREDDDEVWYRWMSLSSLLTAIAGIIEDRVTHLDKLDREDLWAWFRKHGLDQRLLPEDLRTHRVEGGQPQGSPAIAAVYETLFAHGKDDPVPRELAAGVGLRWFLLSAFGYAGYPAYEFKHSAAQTMLTPYYRALTEALGVRVNFFHRVTALEVEGEGKGRRLVGVKLQRQATVKDGPAAYRPFATGVPASNPTDQPPWPIEPDYDQLVEGERLRSANVDLESPYSSWTGVEEVELRLGRDFDLCVLGIPLGALPPVTKELWNSHSGAYDLRWARMLRDIAIIRTVSLQLWIDRPEPELYDVPPDVDGRPGTGRGLLTGFVKPEPSMGDMTHILQWEGWQPGPRAPRFLAYHTGSLTAIGAHDLPPFTDHDYPDRTAAAWREQARQWLKANHVAFYAKAPASWERFVECLVVPSTAAPDVDRFAAQYFNAGALPSDHYVLSQPRGMAARMGQMESGVAGLYLCGDWTRTDMNCGCVEAATQSGMLCARGISGHPVFVWHPGF
jgi:uncharacterized protein with NAD-binding domain and iron-sulfur cluster